MEEAENICNRVIMINKGKIIKTGHTRKNQKRYEYYKFERCIFYVDRRWRILKNKLRLTLLKFRWKILWCRGEYTSGFSLILPSNTCLFLEFIENMKNNLWNILKKELRELFRDKKSLAMMLIIPIFIPLLVVGMSALLNHKLAKM